LNVKGEGKLVVEGNSVIKGTLKVDEKGTLEFSGGTVTVGENGWLDIDGTLDISTGVTIGSGGKLSLLGERAAAEVYKGYVTTDTTDILAKKNAVLKFSGSLAVENGGRLIMPDPQKFDLSKVKGEIEVKAGGELFLFTGAPPLDSAAGLRTRHHPLIGTTGTEAGDSMGADFVMNPGANPGSKIKITFISSKKPELVLTGKATALGPLDYNDPDWSKRRSLVWLTYAFTVDENSVLQVGGSEERYSSLLVLGSNYYQHGFESGKLTNKGKILISKKSGILTSYGGSISPKDDKVYKQQGGDGTNPTLIKKVDVKFSIIKTSPETDDGTVWGDDWGLMSGENPVVTES